ncbi:MAG: hypothetical protein JWM33_3288 [Caulobacteraceae bacterium]|nr:hypothetical protein [Caulobacteraceae bacterium]
MLRRQEGAQCRGFPLHHPSLRYGRSPSPASLRFTVEDYNALQFFSRLATDSWRARALIGAGKKI